MVLSENNISVNNQYNTVDGKVSVSTVFFRILIILIWSQYTLWTYVVEVIKRLPFIGMIAEFVMPVCIILCIVFALPYIIQHVRAQDLFFYFVPVLIVCLTYLLYSVNEEYINENLWRMLGIAIPLYYLGLSYNHDICKKDLFWFSLLGVVAMSAYQIYYINSGRIVTQDNMNAAYNVLPSILFLGYWAFERKRLGYWILFILSTVLLFIFGTRGPLLAVAVFITFEIVARLIISKASVKRYILFFVIVILIFAVLSTNLIIEFMEFLSQCFEEIGFSTRIFDMFIEGELSYSSGRDKLSEQIVAAIGEKPILGYGIFGDRVITGGSYVHNIFLELWCDFGIFIGTAVMIALIVLIVKALKCSKDGTVFYFILMLISLVFTKLMLSGSYLTEQYLFFLIGLSVKAMRDYGKRSNGKVNINENSGN